MTNGRDGHGRFAGGNTIAAGTRAGPKSRAVEERYFKAFKKVVTTEEWEIATLAILREAQEGDVPAYRVLAQYNMGLPVQRIEQEIVSRSEVLHEFTGALDRAYAGSGDNGGVPEGSGSELPEG